MTLPRSYLFVPGDRPERFAKALASGADVVVLDLEDAVAPAAKSAARDAVADFLATTDAPERLVVRINDESTPWFEDDLAVLRAHAARAVMLPKAERAASVERVRAACPGLRVAAVDRECTRRPGGRAHRGLAGCAAPGLRHHRLRARHGPAGRTRRHGGPRRRRVAPGPGLASGRHRGARGGRDRGDRRRDATARRPDARPRPRLRREAVHPPETDRRRSRAAGPQRRRTRAGPNACLLPPTAQPARPSSSTAE